MRDRLRQLGEIRQVVETCRDLGRGALRAAADGDSHVWAEDALDIFDREIDNILGYVAAREASTWRDRLHSRYGCPTCWRATWRAARSPKADKPLHDTRGGQQ